MCFHMLLALAKCVPHTKQEKAHEDSWSHILAGRVDMCADGRVKSACAPKNKITLVWVSHVHISAPSFVYILIHRIWILICQKCKICCSQSTVWAKATTNMGASYESIMNRAFLQLYSMINQESYIQYDSQIIKHMAQMSHNLYSTHAWLGPKMYHIL